MKMLDRRKFFMCLSLMATGTILCVRRVLAEIPKLRIAFLHLAPVPGDVTGNRLRLQNALQTAADNGADWVLTPELCTSGYAFASRIGTDWIEQQPDEWMRDFCRQVVQLGVTVFLSQAEKDPGTGRLHNSIFVIGPDGGIIGRHRKIQTLRVGSEAWSSPGGPIPPIMVPPLGPVGLLICADAYPAWIAKKLKEQGAEILVSAAAWGPGQYGPAGEWERCTRDTGLPLLVCNRTGMDGSLDFTHANSVIAVEGRRLLSMSSVLPAIFLIDWDVQTQRPFPQTPTKIVL